MVGGLLVLGLAVYAQTLTFGFIGYDDPDYVVNNPMVQSGLSLRGLWWALGFANGNWHPLTWWSLMLDAQVYGLHAGGYHLTNLVLHLAAAMTLFCWWREASGQPVESAVLAALFVVHPLHVESVAWVTERKDVLSAWLGFLSLWFYTRYVQARDGRSARPARSYGLSLWCFGAGLAAKSNLVPLPGLLVLLDFWPLRRGVGSSWVGSIGFTARVWDKLPFLVLSGAAATLTYQAAAQGNGLASDGEISLWTRVSGTAWSYAIYLGRTFWPWRLCAFYGSPLSLPHAAAGAAAASVGLAGITWWAWSVRGRCPYVFTGWFWYLGMLLPVSGIVPLGNQYVPDRYAYLPHLGILVLTVHGGAALARRWATGRRGRLATGGLVAAVVLTCAVISARLVPTWRDGLSVYRRALACGGPRAHLDVLSADYLVTHARAAEAEPLLVEAYWLDPTDDYTASRLGDLRLRQERWTEAVALLTPLVKPRPARARIIAGLGDALRRCGRDQAAEVAYRLSRRLRPDFVPVHLCLAHLYQDHGLGREADTCYRAALRLDPDCVDALLALTWRRCVAVNGLPADVALAAQLAERAASLTRGTDSAVLDALVVTRAALEDWDGATVAAEAAVRRSPPGAGREERQRRWQLVVQRRRPDPAPVKDHLAVPDQSSPVSAPSQVTTGG